MHPNVFYALKALGKLAGTAALKARVMGQLAPLKAYLAAHVGAQIATMSVGIIATAAAAAWWQKLNGGSEEDMERAASEAGARGAAREIAHWVQLHL